MDLKPGSRWKSAVCDTEVVIVRPPKRTAELGCGGHPMVPHAEAKSKSLTLSPGQGAGSQLGKRFADKETGVEVLCVKPGAGSLSIDGRLLGLKEAKKLPSSD